MKELTVSLNRAHKLAERLSDIRNRIRMELCGLLTPVQISLSNIGVHKGKDDEAQVLLNKFKTISDDLCNLRKIIGDANIKHGVSDKLSEKQKLATMTGLYSSLIAARRGCEVNIADAVSYVENAPKPDATASRYGIEVTKEASKVTFVEDLSIEKMQEQLVSLQKQQYYLDDFISEANKNTIKITFDDSSYSEIFTEGEVAGV